MMALAGTDVAALEEYQQWRTGKENDMAIPEANMARERTRREVIDEMLLRAANLVRENDQAALRLQGLLVGAPAGEQRPERPCRPGWLGELQDALEDIIGHLTDTAKVMEDVSRQVALPTPTAITPRR